MTKSEFPESENISAQPVVLSTLQKVLRALEVVEETEDEPSARAGIIKAKGVVALFANIWGAGFEEESVEGLLARKYSEQEAPSMVKKKKRVPHQAALIDGLRQMNGREFTSKDLCRLTGLSLEYISPRCAVMVKLGQLRQMGVKPSKGHSLNVYKVVRLEEPR